MTRDEALKAAIDACTAVMRACAEVNDWAGADNAMQARRMLQRQWELWRQREDARGRNA